MPSGVVIEFSQFGNFDSFDILRSTSPINPALPPSPLVTGLKTMSYIDRTTVLNTTYYYRVAVWRGTTRLISAVDIKVVASDNYDPHWANVICLLGVSNGVIVDSAPLSTGTWSNVNNQVVPSEEKYLSEQSMFFPEPDAALISNQDMALGLANYTFEAFIKPGQMQFMGSMLAFYDGGYYILSIGGSLTTPFLEVFSVSAAYGRVKPAVSMQDRWCHVAITRVSGKYNIFVDGVLIKANVSATTKNLNGTTPIIGASELTGTGDNYTGYIEQIRITKGVVRYTASFPPLTQPFPINP